MHRWRGGHRLGGGARLTSPHGPGRQDALHKAFALQVGWCRDLASPFTAALIERLAEDLAAGGPVADLVGDWPGHPLADAVSLRLAGALHAAALSGSDPALRAVYPAQAPNATMDQVWPLARAYLEREAAAVKAFLQQAPQTNETRRTIAMLPGFLACAAHGPLHLREIGASAGLNLHWDEFRFRTASWSWGQGRGPEIDTDWQGGAPPHLDATIEIASRAGVDIHPLDVRDPDQRIRLKSYVWADQADRLARIDAAIDLAAASEVRLEQGDAGAWLTAQLAAPLPPGVTVVFHSVVWQYLPEASKRAAQAAIEAAGARADARHRLAWLRYEPNPMLDQQAAPSGFGVALTEWPGGKRGLGVVLSNWPGATTQRLADVDGHARQVTSLIG